ncbi:lantibiotic dehydratase C-terminal domain-containing protein [Corallococcus caeni]|uniref:Thiopeptide-type bacteriocin biosynthesis domain-containing protein n=1 Tax=Corallococcus caeni TaxID=3082388 RepID=A0ABQ6QVD0_9BACT|nr:hypothetical protein ASNO1_42410 [Corallococcus sp. NO1]
MSQSPPRLPPDEATFLEQPSLSASIYCDGRVDEVIQTVMLPFRQWAQTHHPRTRLWLMRYLRGGEHLKVRLHGPPHSLAEARRELAARVAETFASWSPPVPDERRRQNNQAPPLDPEDEDGVLKPDLTLHWTRYQHRPEQQGPLPLAATPGFASGYVACMVAATRTLFDHVARPSGTASRGTLLIRLIAEALTGLEWSPQEERAALLFHRDWLVSGTPHPAQVQEALAQRCQADEATLRRLEAFNTDRHANRAAPRELPLFAWAVAAHLDMARCTALASRRGPPVLSGDRELFATLARVQHNAANVLGLSLGNELHVIQLFAESLASVNDSTTRTRSAPPSAPTTETPI